MPSQSASQTVGPFFHYGLIHGSENLLVNQQTLGERILIRGRVLDGDGNPIPDAMVEIWQADAGGRFNHPADPQNPMADPNFRGFGRSPTDVQGTYTFHTIKPGPVSGAAVPYINARVFSRGILIHTVTRMYFSDHNNTQDPVFASIDPARSPTLVAARKETAEGTIYHWDIRLQGEGETVFFDLV